MATLRDRLQTLHRQLSVLANDERGSDPASLRGADDEAVLAAVEGLVDAAIARSRAAAQERLLFDHGPVVVFRWSSAEGWPVEYVSPNVLELTGYPHEDFSTGRRPYSQVIAPEDLAHVGAEVASNSRSGVAWFEHDPYRVVRADGRKVWVADYTVVVRDAAGAITHYYGYIMDIGARHELLLQQAKELRQLGTPVLRVWKGVLALPLIGNLDAKRADRVLEVLLGAVSESGVRVAVIDLTGVEAIDSDGAGHLLKLVQAVGLLGADCVLSGISPAVALLFLQQAIDMQRVRIFATLEDALAHAMRRAAGEGVEESERRRRLP
jgi:anti-anti-sigma factor